MIQRIQSVYLFIAIVLLITAAFVGNFFEIVTDEARFAFNGFGIAKSTLDNKELIEQQNTPFYLIPMLLAAFAVIVLFSFKKIDKQFRFSKLLWGAYLLLIVALAVWMHFFAPDQVSGKVLATNYGAAFFVLVIGLPFTHLAYMGIGKDKKTLDSLNRLR
jgi:uncharacterized membrane protein YraQ (UPF0718 family)